jgi:hypothetical protein
MQREKTSGHADDGSKMRAERAAEPGFRLDPNGIVRIEPTTMGLAS